MSLATEKGINLTESVLVERNAEGFLWYVLTEELKEKYLEDLDPARFAENDLKLVYEASDYLKEASFSEMREPMVDGIRILHQYLRLAQPSTVIMLHIG